jgi:uncharacterized protein (TIGR03084 family)
MEQILGALGEQHAELAGLAAGLDEAAWARPSPCDGWTVSDVVLHMAQTDEMAVASLDHRMPQHLDEVASTWASAGDVDDGAGLLVAEQRGASGAEVFARWQAATDALRARFGAYDPHERVTWVAGQLSAMTLATTRLAECWIHTTDVAGGLGVDLVPTDRLRHIARLAWRTVPYAFVRAGRDAPGPVAFHLTGPGGEEWLFDPDAAATTVVSGPAWDLCRVAGQRAVAADTALAAEGPDADAVLELVRTFA